MMQARIPLVIAMAVLFANVNSAFGQEQSPNLDTVVVTGNRIQSESLTKPRTVIDSDELNRRQASTLGEILRGLPGVSASGFGSNASRPIIRGQEGDRVKILQNSSPVNDGSAMSFDHAVGVSPYALEQIEILQGASALLYGANPLGGVVNMVNRRIPNSRLDEVSRSVDLRVDSANNSRQAALELESPIGGDWFMHLDVFTQKNGETRTPLFTDNGDNQVTGRRIRNSSANSNGLGLGFSKLSGAGYWGFSAESDQSTYGVPKEITTTINMDRNRLAFAADQKISDGLFERIRIRAGLTDYQHKELESGATTSIFKNQANDVRLELSHRSLAGWKGVTGLQWEYSDFDVIAVQEDPLMPRTKSPKLGLFALEETRLGSGTARIGARIEHAELKAGRTFSVGGYGDTINQGAITTTGNAKSRSFFPLSASLEYIQPVSSVTDLGLSLSHVQRAPSNYELFATGIHHASGLFELGNTSLDKEKGNHLELSLTQSLEKSRVKASVFYSRYSNFLTLIKRGSGDTEFYHEHEPGVIEPVPVYDYSGVGARFYGGELAYSTSFKRADWTINPKVTYDYVVGKRTSNNAYIPRQTPQRLIPSLDLRSGPWLLRGEMQFVGKAKLGENETVQANAYSLVNMIVQYQHGPYQWFAKATNLTNRLAFNANTVDEVRQFTPIAGRALQAGVRLYF